MFDRLDDVQMLVTRRQSLITLIDALKTGLRDKPFPIAKLYTKWRCRYGVFRKNADKLEGFVFQGSATITDIMYARKS